MDDTPTVTRGASEAASDEVTRADRIEITQGGIRDARAGSIS